ncbi:MAG: hypothetical protein L6V93_15250 [Clostridiales bacterium]|nr:MAG: hypothetical protein L6V93_15250 [Clostridiales bacterium]
MNDVSDAASDVETADLTIVDTEKFLETSKKHTDFSAPKRTLKARTKSTGRILRK